MKKITPFLWFDKDMKGIIDFYKSVFPDMKVSSGGELEDTPSGAVQMATIEILGQELSLMTAGPIYKFSEAISLMVTCDTQEEIDYYWEKLTTDGGSEGPCGWLKDKYGLSWQIAPSAMNKMMKEGSREQIKRVTEAFMKMKKFDIKTLEDVYNQS
jgi:predicted 3-demethylubiquinone-9 3-methyltransferase (glyoxalase superfamily)